MKLAKLCTILVGAVVISTAVTSWWWVGHLRKTVLFMTLTTLKTDIRSDLNALKAIDRKETGRLRNELEQNLAADTISLLQVLRESGADPKESQGLLRALRGYNFQSTNEEILAAMSLLRTEP